MYNCWGMFWFQYFSLFSFGLCLFACAFHFFRLIRLGNSHDNAKPAGNTSKAISYSMIKAMSPTKKETAFLHLPTYTAGIVFHLGTFASLLLFILSFFFLLHIGLWSYVIATLLSISGLSGIAILIKRIVNPKLRQLSNPDDFISNIVVSSFQLITAATAVSVLSLTVYYVAAGVLFLYLPLGKLKHTVYFFAARYHLGYFFGYRGVWPPNKV